jgi:signal transduction histidine kinase/CheY-like chemotaxis protein
MAMSAYSFNRLPEWVLPPEALTSSLTRARYTGVYRSLLALEAMILGIIPFYLWVRGAMNGDELFFVALVSIAPLVGILVIRLNGSLTLGMLTTTALTTTSFADFAFNTGGLTSFIIPWFLVNLAVQGIFGSLRTLYITFAILLIEMILLLFADQTGLLPPDTTPMEVRSWAFALSILTALTAIVWVDSVSIEIRSSSKARLTAARIEAEAGNIAKSAFISNMSHELRTPLNAVIGFSQLLEDDPDKQLNEEQAENVNQVLLAGRHLLTLVNDILDLSRIESEDLAGNLENVDLQELISISVDLLASEAARQQISITMDCPENTFARTDQNRLRQIVLNLVSNAVKYNKPGGTVSVSLTTSQDGLVGIIVSDTGQGISVDNLANLFQPFNRLGMENSGVDGSGIGLVISRKLAELMGGRIEVISEEGKGSTFTVFVPAPTKDKHRGATEETNAVSRDTALQPSMSESGFTVLCVEDNLANRKLIEHIFNRIPDARTLFAEKAERGLELARAEMPDVILMDINLPGISGIDAHKKLKNDKKTQDIPVIAITAHAMSEDLAKGEQEGFFAYLTKPIQVDEVLTVVEQALSVRS